MANDPRRFTLSLNTRVLERILALNRRALALGLGPEWGIILRRIEERLQTIPREAGDPFRHYPGLKLASHQLLLDRILVHYTVHDTADIVFIQSLDPVLGHPLEDEA